jgi:hypothetical protein
MKKTLSSCFNVISNTKNNPAVCMKQVLTILSSFKSIQNSLSSLVGNHHLLQSIINNYCDNIKIIHDVPFVPSIEEVHLYDLIRIIIEAVKTSNGSEAVVDLEYDESIRSMILTDVQWLQDNIFCCLLAALQTPSLNSRDQDGRKVTFRVFLTVFQSSENNILINTSNMIRFEIESCGISYVFCQEPEEKANHDQEKEYEGGTMEDADLAFSCLIQRVLAFRGQYGIDIGKENEDILFWFSIPYIASSREMNDNILPTLSIETVCPSSDTPPVLLLPCILKSPTGSFSVGHSVWILLLLRL